MWNKEQIDEAFTYHKPSEEQIQQIEIIRETAKELAKYIFSYCPECADRTAALRKVREAVMTANASIVLDGLI